MPPSGSDFKFACGSRAVLRWPGRRHIGYIRPPIITARRQACWFGSACGWQRPVPISGPAPATGLENLPVTATRTSRHPVLGRRSSMPAGCPAWRSALRPRRPWADPSAAGCRPGRPRGRDRETPVRCRGLHLLAVAAFAAHTRWQARNAGSGCRRALHGHLAGLPPARWGPDPDRPAPVHKRSCLSRNCRRRGVSSAFQPA